MGAILLIGLDVKNGIILIEYIGQLREQGMPLHEALLKAGRTRFRPILMTSLCTILGLVPLAMGFGPGAQMQQPLAIAVIGGLITNMLLTRLLIPVGYLVLKGRAVRGNRTSTHVARPRPTCAHDRYRERINDRNSDHRGGSGSRAAGRHRGVSLFRRESPMRWSRTCLVVGMIIMNGAVVNAEDAPPAGEDAKLDLVFQNYLRELFRREPLTATKLGEHSHDDQLDDLSAEARKATLEFQRETLADAPPKSIDAQRALARRQDRLRDLPRPPRARGLAGAKTSGPSRTTRESTATTSPRASICC